ncbi:MAG: ATP-binding protein [Bacilli bacterium]|nr:ATP-binding protein [Bacilli bacterium]
MTDQLKSNIRSILKTYRKTIWKKTIKAINEYQLISENDKIAVCISGGKDSFLLALLLREINRHHKIKFELKYIVMDPGYNKDTIDLIKKNAKDFDLEINIFKTKIFNDIKAEKNPCYVCARKRRGNLYNKALELGCNKIALGHHFDDVIETIMLNILYAGTYGSMMPKLKSDNYPNMELIRPLYLVKEYDIDKWVKYNNLTFINCACDIANKKTDSKRAEIKELIKNLRKVYKDIDKNIFKSSENINLNTVLGYHYNKEKYHFLDKY